MKEKLPNSLEHYRAGAKKIGHIAERDFSLVVSPQIYDTWDTLAIVLRLADQKIDGLPSEEKRSIAINQGLKFLAGETNECWGEWELTDAMHLFRNRLNGFPPTTRDTFMGHLKLMCRVTSIKREVKKPVGLVRLARLEGQICAKLFLCFLSDEGGPTKNFQDFIKFITRMGRVANVTDDFFDLPADYHGKESGVPATILNRLLILGGSIPDAFFVLRRRPMRTLRTVGLRAVYALALDSPPHKTKSNPQGASESKGV